jgi:hypothetical protein
MPPVVETNIPAELLAAAMATDVTTPPGLMRLTSLGTMSADYKIDTSLPIGSSALCDRLKAYLQAYTSQWGGTTMSRRMKLLMKLLSAGGVDDKEGRVRPLHFILHDNCVGMLLGRVKATFLTSITARANAAKVLLELTNFIIHCSPSPQYNAELTSVQRVLGLLFSKFTAERNRATRKVSLCAN